MDSSPLNRLSNEVLHLIIDLLSSPDCRALRATCRLFSTLARSRAYSDLIISMFDFKRRCDNKTEGFPELVAKYGPLVKHLTLDGRNHVNQEDQDSLSPMEVHAYLVQLPNLETLCLYGETPEFGYQGRANLFELASALFERAGLLTRFDERVFRNLRTLKAKVSSLMGPLWALPFLMDGLETLHLMDITLDHRDPIGLPTEYHRQTNLKKLTIESSYINVVALAKLLAFPRALTHLELDHRPDEWEEENPWTAERVYAAVVQQRASLEVVRLRCTEESRVEEWEARSPVEGGLPPHVYEETGGVFDLSSGVFPRLRVYDGLYVDSSGRFVPGR